MSTRVNVLPIGDNRLLMIGIDGCVEGSFVDWDMDCVALDRWICQGLALGWDKMCGLRFDSQIGQGMTLDWRCIGTGLMPS